MAAAKKAIGEILVQLHTVQETPEEKPRSPAVCPVKRVQMFERRCERRVKTVEVARKKLKKTQAWQYLHLE